MKATFVLIASNKTKNKARKIMLEAHKKGNLGFEMTRLPHHISLKQPFSIESLEGIENYFDRFVATLEPITVKFEDIYILKSDVFGIESGLMGLNVENSKVLVNLHNRLNKELEEQFGACPVAFDGCTVLL